MEKMLASLKPFNASYQRVIVRLLTVMMIGLSFSIQAFSQSVLIDYNFQSTPMPAGLSSDGSIGTSSSASPCVECSVGRIAIALSGFFQIDVESTSEVSLNMKSSASGTRNVTVKYKKEGQEAYTTVGSVQVPGAGGRFDLHFLFPDLVSQVPISIRLENAPSGGQFHIHDVFVRSSATALMAAEILSFKIPGQKGTEVINSAAATIDLNVPLGTPLVNIVPSEVTISNGATIQPLPTAPQDFSNGAIVNYEVTAPNGTTKKNWKVKVTEVLSEQKEILAFKLSAQQLGDAVIDAVTGNIKVIMPESINLSNLIPVQITLSPFATIQPAADISRDFSSPVVYEVTAQDGSVKPWTVTVLLPNEAFIDYEAEHAIFTGTVESNHAGFSGSGFVNFLTEGENSIIFTVCQVEAGERTIKFRYALGADEARPGRLYVNDVFVKEIAFSPTANWATWLEETETIALLSGISNVKITWDETDGPSLDKLSLSGSKCTVFQLNVSATNGGAVSLSPNRFANNYFSGETVTLLAETLPSLSFDGWSGDASGSDNPLSVVMDAGKNIVANFSPVPTFKVQVNVTGVGQVTLSPAGGEYPSGSTVTLTANAILGSNFVGWGGDASGTNPSTTLLVNADKSVTAAFTNSPQINFEQPVGFATVNTGSTYPDFNGPVTGGQNAADTFWVNGPADFDALAWRLYYRNRAYRLGATQNGVPKAPLVIVFKEGVYPEGTSASSAWGNSMMTIQEQGDLTIIGEKNVVLKWGFNIKRSWNILIRNIHFQDYNDDGINIGEPETHHIWIDHCTLGHPTTRPVNTELPDGGIDSKSGASYITISWSLIRNSWKTSLVGHSDNNGAEDIGKLKITYFANHFVNTNSRNPRLRFGEVHFLNNLNERISLYGIAAAKDARVVAEGNFYLNTRWPMYADRSVADFRAVYGNNTDNVFTSKTGNTPAMYLKQFNNDYDDSGLPVITAQILPSMLNPGGRSVRFDELNPHLAFDPKSYYNYIPFTPEEVRAIVPLFAGADKVDFFTPVANVPELAVSHSLETFTQYEGIPSAAQTYTVAGSKLNEGITITPPQHYEVSADNGSTWFSNVAPLVLPQTAGNVPTTQINLRLNAPALGNYSGIIEHATLGIDAVQVPVNGNTVASIYPPGTAVVVAADGSGNFTSVQAAINAAPTGRNTPYIIFIKNGKYYEKITVPSNKPFIHLVGESVANVLLYHNTGASDPLPGGGDVGTQNSASFTVNATDFAAFNITFANTYGDGTQGVAVLVNNDRAVFKNCRFLGNQDTLYVKGSGTPRQYFRDCYIDGNVDFIFGSAAAVIDSSVVYAKSRNNAGNSFITAASTPAGQSYGFVFRNVTIPENTGATRYFLGRPWQNSSAANTVAHNKTVFLNTTMGNNVIRPEGWIVWDAGTNTSLIYYGEFNSRDFSGNPVNVSQRVPWSYQLTQAEADSYTPTNIFGSWNPCSIPGVCTNEARDIAIANFRGRKQADKSILEWNISWAKTGLLYEIFRASAKAGPYEKIGEITAANDTAYNFRWEDQLPAAGSAFFYYVQGSLGGFAPHIPDTIEISSKPTIRTTGVLQTFVQMVGEPSAAQSLTVSGENLLGPVGIAVPAPFQISIDNGNTWVSHPNTIALPNNGTVLGASILRIRLNASDVGNSTGSLLLQTTGGDDVAVVLNGQTILPPDGTFITLQHWPFTSNANDLASDRAVGVTPSTPTLVNLFVSNGTQVPAIQAYSNQFGQAIGASSNGDGSWSTGIGGPGGTLRYGWFEQFTVTADAGYKVRVDSLYVTAAFYNTSSNTRLAVMYSRSGFVSDSADVFTVPGGFSNPISLANQTSGPTNRYAMSFAGPDGITLQPGETLTFKFYFSCSSSSAGRYAMLKNVLVTGNTEPADVLPLRLRSFTATRNDQTAHLTWQTDREVQTSHFDIEKSIDGNKFVSIGKVAANNTSGVHNYAFDDNQLAALNYYRLKMVDNDGSFRFSPVVLVKTEAIENVLNAYPNPVRGQLQVAHGILQPGSKMVVATADGRVLMEQPVQNGTPISGVNMATLPKGLYLIMVMEGTGRKVLKVIKE
jgi:pectin methylesterase-like acyl-CoA thioesterase/pectate lyase